MGQERQGGWWGGIGGLLHLAREVPVARIMHIRRDIFICLDVLMAIGAAAAICSLAMDYGFYERPVPRIYLHGVQSAVLALFVLDRIIRLLLVDNRRTFLRENWIDFVLIVLATVVLVLAGVFGVNLLVLLASLAGQLGWKWQLSPDVTALSAAAIYVVITQVYILIALVLRLAGFQALVVGSGIHPAWMLLGSFATVILFGTGLLLLPQAVPAGQPPLSFVDALFTAVSANCVTGLTVRSTAELSNYGQVVILLLLQVGGLGIMIFGTAISVMLGRAVSIHETLSTGQSLAQETLGRIGRLAKFALLTTLVIELIGAMLCYPMWRGYYDGLYAQGLLAAPESTGRVVFTTVFHSVSAFCNAGFSLQDNSLVGVRGCWPTVGVIAPLIVLGGLGFPVLYDLARMIKRAARRILRREEPRGPVLSLHGKIVLTTTAALIVIGAGGLMLIERHSDKGDTFGAPIRISDNEYARSEAPSLARLPLGEQVREAVFESVTARTAGFNTVSQAALSQGGKLWVCLLMLVGGGPAGTAGGMKTITLAVIVLTIWSALRRRQRVEAFRRTIPDPFIRKAMIIAAVYLSMITVSTVLLCVAMSDTRLPSGQAPGGMELLFEACSAAGTVGLSCDVTSSLTEKAKLIIMAAMFLGRVGPLTLLLALTARIRPERYAYPNGEVILG